MDELLKKIGIAGGLLKIVDGNLKLFSDGSQIDPEILNTIRTNKKEITAYLIKNDIAAIYKSEYENISLIPLAETYAISSAQRRLWVLSQFEGSSVAYNIPESTYLDQDIDIEHFKRAIDSTLERHEILRTVFKEDATGEIRQWILKKEDLGFNIDYKDFRKEENKEEKVKQYIAEDSYKAFDLEKGPLLRAGLLRVEDEAYVFYYNMHHIISDGWSMEVLTKDVLSYYEAYKESKEPKLKELRIQYKDYSAWALAQLEEESFKVHRAYWLNSLQGNLPLLDLPGTKQRPKIKTHNGQGLSTYIDGATTDKLKKYSQENGGSLFMSLLAAWNILMYRYTSQKDIIIGSPIAGRDHADLEDQIGFYVNILALRNEIKPEESFNAFYRTLKDNTLKSYNHQMYPFDRLVEELNLQRDPSRSAVFDVMFVLQNNGEKLEGLKLKEEELNRIVDLGYSASKFDIDIAFQEQGDYLSLQVVYNPEVYEREMIEGLINHYRRLLNALLESPEEKVSQIDYLSQDEKHELLVTFNDTKVSYPKDKTIIDLFEEQVAKTPDNVAVVFEEKELTYRELNEQSNQLAHYLQKNYDIKSNDLVGIKQERSEWMIISILGVLKSGGAYVPIDPEYPADRIAYMLENSDCKICIDEAELDIFRDQQKRYSIDKLSTKFHSDNLAYVIYTSGSTGMPKGVMISSRSIIDYSFGVLNKTNINECVSFGLVSTIAADLGNTVIYTSLLIGGSLHVIAKEDILNVDKLQDSNLDCLKMTPSHWKALQTEQRFFVPNKCLILGGEQFSEEILKRIKLNKAVCEVYNHYGPTETTIGKLIKHIDKKQSAFEISLGMPIGNNQVYILNTAQQLCPVRVIGEICISGAGLARGYLNQEELTKEKFIANPFKEGERLYKTGDLGRWLPNGNIEFIGRKDDQVKIRGYRIELGEIEHALLKNQQIEEAVVLAKENHNNEKELVAYITAKEQQNKSDLRSCLKELLPEYMLPAYYVQLEALPLTSNGKIDKKSLPDPEGLGLTSGIEYVAPRNEIEEKLVKIWQKVLQRENIGVKDDFFALGGHSLKAVRLSNEYGKELEAKLTLKDLFAHTSIESHVELIQSSKRSEFIQIEKLEEKESYPISNAQRRLWVLSQFEEGSVAYNMPASIVVEKSINIESFKRAIESTIERHEILRTVFKENETGEIRQWVLKKEDLGFKIDYKDFRKEENKEEKVQSYIREDSYKAFDLEKGPLLRASLLQVEDEAYVFYYNMHHIISDGWSMEVLSKDVFSYYEAYKENKEPKLKELRIQYKDYSAWQLAELEEESFKAHRDYWLDGLKGELPLLDLPSSKKRPDVKTHKGRTVVTYLNKDLTGKLRNYALDRDGTLFIGIVSAVKSLLYRYTGQEDLILGTSIAGRHHSDLENQIGFYVNTLALRSKISGRDSFDQVYQKVKHTILEAYTHQIYPFDRLVEELQQSRLASRSAVFDIKVVLQNTGESVSELSIPEERIDDIIEIARGTSIYDIRFDFKEEGDYLRFLVEYNNDVYEGKMIEGFMRHFKEFTTLALLDPRNRIDSINYLSSEEKQDQLSVLESKVDYPGNKTIVDLLQEQVKKHKQNPVIILEDRGYSYEELNKRSNQVAHFLLKEVGIEKEEKVGLLLNPGLDTIASLLGVLKAGGAYVPMDHGLPEDRLLFMASDVGMRVLITEKEFIESANRLQWGVGSLENYLCIDSDDVKSELEYHKNAMMSQELWDHIGERAENQITGGGWLSSYTGKAIPDVEMEEYSMNAYNKLKSSLHSGMRVLEIGCSSGLTLSKVAPEVGFYYGTDLSPVIISGTKKLIAEKGLKNVKLKQLIAHEISTLEEGDFDLIIINSVIQSFHGHNYLLKVIKDSIKLLKEEGKIFIGDVMDINKKKDLIESLEAFKRDNEGKGYTTKTDFSSNLFVSRGYFEDLRVAEKEIVEVGISEKIRTIENELTKFRYDAILHINKRQSGKLTQGRRDKQQKKHKWQYSATDLDCMPNANPIISITPHQLACVIYTPGSTSRPKGAMVEHRDAVRLFKTTKPLSDFNSSDVWTMFYSYAFNFSVWNLTQLKKESFKAHRDYWLNNLKGEFPRLDLPGTKQRSRIKVSKGRALGTYLNKELNQKIREYSQQRGGTVFMSLLAAWNVLIYRYTSQKDIITGTSIAGRAHADLEDQIGFYVNTLALRNEINPEEGFNELFSRVKQTTLNAYSHQMYPFDRLVEELNLQRDPSRSAVFDVMFVLQNNGEKLEGLKLEEEELNRIVDLGYSASKFDIGVTFQEIGDYLSLQVVYNPEVYEREMIEGLINHYRQLLNALLENQEEKISQIDYLSQEEKHELLVTFNDTEIEYPKDKTIVDLFEEQVAKTPDNIAVVFEEKELTYRELNEQSNQLAHYLQKNYGIKPDDLVGIKQERSEWMIISILGVLKSGGAYVPIDSDYPAERIAYMLGNSNCKVCIDESELDVFRDQQKKYSIDKLRTELRPGNLAYVIYTSGSTGKPKGVMIEHHSLINYNNWFTNVHKINQEDSSIVISSPSFDGILTCIYGCILNGGSLHVLRKDIINSPNEFIDYVQSKKITFLKATPPYLNLLINSERYYNLLKKCEALRFIMTGGDKVDMSYVNRIIKYSGIYVINHYGPTESTIGSASYIVTKSNLIEFGTHQSIGRPMSNTQIHFLNEAKQLQPKGLIGEMYIGGAGLARGYLNQEELTREKFIQNPFKAGERLYKTGDLGRWLPDGNIEFIGRKDDQVKIRGYRIELAEIEHALRSHNEIIEAVVVAKENHKNEKELVAYITSKEEQNTNDLRNYLKEILPEYMLPANYVQLEALPINSNGKIDKKSLQDPQGSGLKSGVEYVAPRNAIEEKLVKIWEEVLQRENIGVKDDFFALGGHSIKVIQANKAYQLIFSKKMPFIFFMSNPTIREHAEHMTLLSNVSVKDYVELIKMNTFSKTNKNMIFIPPIQGESIFFMGLSKFIEDEYNCYGINYGKEHGFNSLPELSNYCAELINKLSFKQTTISVIGYSSGVPIAFEIVKVLEGLNYNCELLLVDRCPNTKSTVSEEYKEMELDRYVDYALKEGFPDESPALIRKWITDIYEVLHNYETTGKIRSDISCLGGTAFPEKLKVWEKYTFGQFNLEKIESSHRDIFKEENYEKLYDFIRKNKD